MLAIKPQHLGKFYFGDTPGAGGGSGGGRGFFGKLWDGVRGKKRDEQKAELTVAMLSTKDCESTGWNSLTTEFVTHASLGMSHNTSMLWKKIRTREEPDYARLNDIVLSELAIAAPKIVFLEPTVRERADITPSVVKQKVPSVKNVVEMRFPDYACVETAMKDADKTIA